nr:immunoglobulin heavy chain junction region [Macaca mulatta]
CVRDDYWGRGPDYW